MNIFEGEQMARLRNNSGNQQHAICNVCKTQRVIHNNLRKKKEMHHRTHY